MHGKAKYSPSQVLKGGSIAQLLLLRDFLAEAQNMFGEGRERSREQAKVAGTGRAFEAVMGQMQYYANAESAVKLLMNLVKKRLAAKGEE